MKALTLTQPHATLVERSLKLIETRSWRTSYRGGIAIHAAKGFPRRAQALLDEDPFAYALNTPPYELPRGAVIATADLYEIIRIPYQVTNLLPLLPPKEPERSFGDYSPGRFAWFLRDVESVYPPVPCKGMLGLWEWDAVVPGEPVARG